MKSIKLIVVGGDLETNEVDLELPATIGRGRESSLSLTHPLVSRQHCELVERQDRIVVRDLDSLNGTFVGSERIAEAVLKPGDLLTVGTVTFRAVYQESADESDVEVACPESSESPANSAETMKGTDRISRPSSDTLRVDPPQEVPSRPSEPSDSPHPAEYDN